MPAALTPALRVAAYIQLRDYKKSAEDEFKKSLKRVNEAMDKLEADLLNDLNQSGATSLSCDSGTVYKNMQTSATVEDRNAFLDFLLTNNLLEALDVKANKTFVKDYMEEHGHVVPGIKFTQLATVGVRRS